MHKLEKIWIDNIQNNNSLTINDLFEFSKINLKNKKNKKKFLKDYSRYIKKEVYDIYFGCQIATPLIRSFKLYSALNIKPISNVEPIITYFDIKHNDEHNSNE